MWQETEYSDRNVGKTNLSFTRWNQRTQPFSSINRLAIIGEGEPIAALSVCSIGIGNGWIVSIFEQQGVKQSQSWSSMCPSLGRLFSVRAISFSTFTVVSRFRTWYCSSTRICLSLVAYSSESMIMVALPLSADTIVMTVNNCFLLRFSSKVHQAYFISRVAISLYNIINHSDVRTQPFTVLVWLSTIPNVCHTNYVCILPFATSVGINLLLKCLVYRTICDSDM